MYTGALRFLHLRVSHRSRLVFKFSMDTIQLNIEGMHCGGCATGIQIETEQLEGVLSVFIDLDGKRGTWEIDSTKVNAERIIASISELGFKATVAS